ncbi:MAG: hypothetical protein ACLP2F_05555 [Steroidobacteraceae bacterium]
MTGLNAPCIVMSVAAICALRSFDVRASEEAVDRATQAALELDAHPDRGALQFKQYCARCHGAEAQGDAARG